VSAADGADGAGAASGADGAVWPASLTAASKKVSGASPCARDKCGVTKNEPKASEVIVREAMYMRLENFCLPIIFIRKKVLDFRFKCLQYLLNLDSLHRFCQFLGTQDNPML
jgi:hypothetical protein